MARRDLLHKMQLTAFKTFLDSRGVPHRPGKGTYQVLQVQIIETYKGTTLKPWIPIYEKDSSTEHYTVQHELVGLVKRFIESRKDDLPASEERLEMLKEYRLERSFLVWKRDNSENQMLHYVIANSSLPPLAKVKLLAKDSTLDLDTHKVSIGDAIAAWEEDIMDIANTNKEIDLSIYTLTESIRDK